jgi:hypothetical protein
MRLVPQTLIVPVLVSGVVWEATAYHWLTRLRRTRIEREKIAAALQLLTMIRRDVRPTRAQLHFAKPIALAEVPSAQTAEIRRVVVDRMRQLLRDLHRPADQSGRNP